MGNDTSCEFSRELSVLAGKLEELRFLFVSERPANG